MKIGTCLCFIKGATYDTMPCFHTKRTLDSNRFYDFNLK